MDLFDHADARARIVAARDLLEHPRHSIAPKDRRWLEAELKAEEARLAPPRKARP